MNRWAILARPYGANQIPTGQQDRHGKHRCLPLPIYSCLSWRVINSSIALRGDMFSKSTSYTANVIGI